MKVRGPTGITPSPVLIPVTRWVDQIFRTKLIFFMLFVRRDLKLRSVTFRESRDPESQTLELGESHVILKVQLAWVSLKRKENPRFSKPVEESYEVRNTITDLQEIFIH